MLEAASVGIVSRFDRRDAVALATSIARYVAEKGVQVEAERHLRLSGNGIESVPLNKMDADMILTVGGDGTVLRTCAHIPLPETPLLTVNMGNRGFLTEVEPDDVWAAIDRCLVGEYSVERCMKLSSSAGDIVLPDSLNELFVASSLRGKMASLRVWRDSVPMMRCYSDGLIMATPTGSTAQSLSSGGAVLDPSLDAIILTPVCSSTPAYPIVVPANAELSVELSGPRGAKIYSDGNCRGSVGPAQRITVRKSRHHACFVRFRNDFYVRLSERLFFSIPYFSGSDNHLKQDRASVSR